MDWKTFFITIIEMVISMIITIVFFIFIIIAGILMIPALFIVWVYFEVEGVITQRRLVKLFKEK